MQLICIHLVIELRYASWLSATVTRMHQATNKHYDNENDLVSIILRKTSSVGTECT